MTEPSHFTGDLVGVEVVEEERDKVASIHFDARSMHGRASLTWRPRLQTLDMVSLLVGDSAKEEEEQPLPEEGRYALRSARM
jgi:hypothetical protein